MNIRQFAAPILVAVLLLAGSVSTGLAQDGSAPAPSRLVSPADLATMATLGDVQIIDIRSEKRLAKGTVPGATWITYRDWRGPQARPGRPMDVEDLETLLGGAGLRSDLPTVVANQSGRALPMGQAAYVYWLLKSAGFEDLAILQGGFKAWAEADLQVAETPSTRAPQIIDLTYRYDWWADPTTIFGIATHQMEGAILDARFDAQVAKSIETGRPMMSIPLAQLVPVDLIAENITAARLTPASQEAYRASLRARDIALGDDTLISVCQTGELSALSWFYASEIVGIEKVLYYPDAIQGWDADGGLLFGLQTANR